MFATGTKQVFSIMVQQVRSMDMQWLLDPSFFSIDHGANMTFRLLVEDGIFKPGAAHVFDLVVLMCHIFLAWSIRTPHHLTVKSRKNEWCFCREFAIACHIKHDFCNQEQPGVKQMHQVIRVACW